ncbi:MAG: hypothetical protein GY757_25645 [bacterium]|nr:hypothetical protein [bacterium]
MDTRKNLPIGMGTATETMIEDLGFHFKVNSHDLVRQMVKELDDESLYNEFLEYNKNNKVKRIEKTVRIHGFKFQQSDIDSFSKMQWKCRFKGISTFIKQLIYFYHEKYINKAE